MKIHILGSLSGTEPKVDRHHTSWILELDDGKMYMFDAGENCGRSAYLKGLNMYRIGAVFISHCHIDHIGGLFNFFGVVRKMRALDGDETPRKIALHFPKAKVAGHVTSLLELWGEIPPHTEVTTDLLTDGGVFDDGSVKIEFKGNQHIATAPGTPPVAYSFRITAENKTVIFSGDVRSVDEIKDWCCAGADLLLMESGHHSPPQLCATWQEWGAPLKQVMFLHHGREYLNFPQETLRKCRNIRGEKVAFADDGTEVCL